MKRLAVLASLAVLFFSTVPVAAAHEGHAKSSSDADVVRTMRSGPWSAAETWEQGKVPGAGAKVLIRTGHRVVYDVASDAVIRGVNVAGELTFATDRDTRLNVGLIKIQPTDE
jgi:hypothetical protein